MVPGADRDAIVEWAKRAPLAVAVRVVVLFSLLSACTLTRPEDVCISQKSPTAAAGPLDSMRSPAI